MNENDLTSICNIELNAKVPIGPPWVVAGCQNDATNGFDLPDDAGHGWGGKDPVLPDDQAANLMVKEQDKPTVRSKSLKQQNCQPSDAVKAEVC